MREDILLLRRRRMGRVALFVGRPLTFVSSSTTITPAVTLSGDGPCQWEVTEGNGAKYYYNTTSFSHTKTASGNMTVRLINTMQVAPYVTQINFSGNGITSSILTMQLGLFKNLTYLNLYNNQFTGDLTGIILPSGLVTLYLNNNQFTGDLTGIILPSGLVALALNNNQLTGNLTNIVLPSGLVDLLLNNNQFTGNLTNIVLPSGLVSLYLHANQFTGNLANVVLPSGLTTLYLFDNQFTGDLTSNVLPSGLSVLYMSGNQFTGLYTVPNPTAVSIYDAQSQGALNMTQSRVDAFISDIYSKRTYFTYATPTFNIGGTNAAPSGVYQFANPPTTGKEKIYWLVNDPLAEGFNKQVWTYTA